MGNQYDIIVAVDETLVRRLAAANGLDLAPQRAADLVPALQAILDADAQIAVLDLAEWRTVGVPWDARQECG